MILLVSGATATLARLPASAPVGHLTQPRAGNRVAQLVASGRMVAADNDCYQGLDPGAYRRMLRALAAHADRVAWVAVPDVVGDARATMRRWRRWRPYLAHLGLRAALVAQDGLEDLAVPWADVDCLFIGGTTEWKEGPAAMALAAEARRRGIWVHVGRVSTVRRLRMWDMLADSIDSSQFSRFPGTYIPRWMEILAWQQSHMFTPSASRPS